MKILMLESDCACGKDHKLINSLAFLAENVSDEVVLRITLETFQEMGGIKISDVTVEDFEFTNPTFVCLATKGH